MKYFYVEGDYNDADYIGRLIELSDEQFESFKPLIKAINEFQPYITEYGWEHHNWNGENCCEEVYSQFSKELLDEFDSEVICRLHVMDDCYIHTITKFIEVSIVGEPLIVGGYHEIMNKRTPETIRKMEEYQRRSNEICSYRRPSDGKSLCSIPFNEMTEEENKLMEEYDNLWKEYV